MKKKFFVIRSVEIQHFKLPIKKKLMVTLMKTSYIVHITCMLLYVIQLLKMMKI